MLFFIGTVGYSTPIDPVVGELRRWLFLRKAVFGGGEVWWDNNAAQQRCLL